MGKKFYLDTSIWLDFFENRDEPNLPKGQWANDLLNKIVKDDDLIIYSDNNLYELEFADTLFMKLKICLNLLNQLFYL